MPDLTVSPPEDLNITGQNEGIALLRFSSVVVNVGTGDFVLAGTRAFGEWAIEQVIDDGTGSRRVALDSEVVWGGDGHDHWHITRVATYRVVGVDDSGGIFEVGDDLIDTKVGFCFFDSRRVIENGPEDPVYQVRECGHEDDNTLRMGLSTGWGDVYTWSLPGQSIDITNLPDGDYRLLAEADESGQFVELTRENNRSWVDFNLSTDAQGLRWALATAEGPAPGATDS